MHITKNKEILLAQLYSAYMQKKDGLIRFKGSVNLVFGEGSPDAHIMFIGEAPGKNEDLLGRPFVGRSGKLLNKALEIAGIERSDVFITNIVKSRPPNNRKPTKQEISQSKPLLMDQIAIINPHIICTLGASALESLVDRPVHMKTERGILQEFCKTALLPTFHPAYILRNPRELKTFIGDILMATQYKKRQK